MSALEFRAFSAEQDRIRANLSSYYDRWLDVRRAEKELSCSLTWKTIGDARYLYEIVDRFGNGRSLGRETPELVAHYAAYQTAKQNNRQDLAGVDTALAETARLYAALNMPMLAAATAQILRECDVARMLGSQLLTVGTNAMLAYEMEAGGRFLTGFDATADCNLAFRGEVVSFTAANRRTLDRTLFGVLKSIDATYTVNTERSFQARNRKAFEVELLAAPSVLGKLPKGELSPIEGMQEQEWLLLGNPVTQVVCGLDRKPTRIICPDPRWMALHKGWLSQQPKRRPEKRKKDAAQAARLFATVQEHMPHYPMDVNFVAAIPVELRNTYDALRR